MSSGPVGVPIAPVPAVLVPTVGALQVLHLHQRVETLVLRLASAVGGAVVIESSGLLELGVDPLADLLVEEQVFIPAVVLRNLELLQDLGLVVEEVGDFDHLFLHVELVLQDPTDDLELVRLLDQLLVGVPLLEPPVAAEPLRESIVLEQVHLEEVPVPVLIHLRDGPAFPDILTPSSFSHRP